MENEIWYEPFGWQKSRLEHNYSVDTNQTSKSQLIQDVVIAQGVGRELNNNIDRNVNNK